MPRLGEKSDPGKIRRGSENITTSVHQRSSEVGIEKIFLRDLPPHYLAGLWSGVAVRPLRDIGAFPREHLLTRSTDPQGSHTLFFAILRLLRSSLGVQTMDNAVLHLVGVAENVTRVKAQNTGEVVYPGDVAISRVRLNHVLPLASSNFPLKHTLKGRRQHFDRCLQRL